MIIEATEKATMTSEERRWKAKLIRMLRDDGKGHYHRAYADRLEDFIINIIPAKDDPEFTASISFDDGIIRISSGFLSNPSTFEQLNVLLRHEMAHNLMMHQIRMMHEISKKYGEKGYSRINMSNSLHQLENIIEDFEISNKRYTADDKQTVKNMWLNGKIIGGLITEEHRNAWKDLSVEDMYNALNNEIDSLNRNILSTGWDKNTRDYLQQSIKYGALYYQDINAETNFINCGLKKFVNNKGLYHFFPLDRPNRPVIIKFSSLPEDWQDVMKSIYEKLYNSSIYTTQDIDKLIKQVANSSATEVIKLSTPATNGNASDEICELYTPEEKLLAVDSLKSIRKYYAKKDIWCQKVIKALGNGEYSQDDIKKIYAALK